MLYVTDAGHATRARIMRACTELMADKAFSQVSVTAICKQAGVSRTTFYNHFKDKFDIAHWHFDLVAHTFLYETGRTYSIYDANYLNSAELRRHRDFYVPMFAYTGTLSLLDHSRQKREEEIVRTLTDYKHVEVDEELAFQAHIYTVAETHAVKEWCCSGMQDSAAHLAALLDDIVPRRLYGLLNQPSL